MVPAPPLSATEIIRSALRLAAGAIEDENKGPLSLSAAMRLQHLHQIGSCCEQLPGPAQPLRIARHDRRPDQPGRGGIDHGPFLQQFRDLGRDGGAIEELGLRFEIGLHLIPDSPDEMAFGQLRASISEVISDS